MAKNLGLGRGLGALINEVPKQASRVEPQETAEPDRIAVTHIRKSPWQPRREFAEDALDDLVQSIAQRGVLQPILVRAVGDHFELIAGERRFRAAQKAGLDDVPAVVMDVADQEALELALVENLQREDLNVIEEAEGYQLLADQFDLTQEKIATQVGKGRATVANSIRLLALSDEIRQLVAEGQLSAGHGKVLLGIKDESLQKQLAHRAARAQWSVRELEKAVGSDPGKKSRKRRRRKADVPEEHLVYLVDQLQDHFGTSVRVVPCRTLPNGRKSKGSIEIDYFSSDELDRLLAMLGLSEQV